MKLFYVMIDFYPDLNEADQFETILCPYHTYKEAKLAMAATIKPYKEDEDYEVMYHPAFDVAYIAIPGIPAQMYRLEVIEGELGYMRPG